MPRVELSNEADADLVEILRYGIETHGRPTAEAYLKAIDHAFDRLADFPELGMLRDVIPPLHCLPCREHRIFYLYDGASVLIVRVLHKRMDAARWLES